MKRCPFPPFYITFSYKRRREGPRGLLIGIPLPAGGFIKSLMAYGASQMIVASSYYTYIYALCTRRFISTPYLYIPYLPYPMHMVSTLAASAYLTFRQSRVNLNSTIVLGRLRYRVLKFLTPKVRYDVERGIKIEGAEPTMIVESYDVLYAMPRGLRSRHMIVAGSSGCGKSATLTYLINEFLRKVRRCKVIVIDPVGAVAKYLSQLGIKHLLIDLSGVNVLSVSDLSDVVDLVSSLQISLAKNFGKDLALGPRQEAILINVLESMLKSGAKLISIDDVLDVLSKLHDKYKQDRLMSDSVLGIINRLQNLVNLRRCKCVLNLSKALESDLIVFILTKLTDLERSLVMEYLLRLIDRHARLSALSNLILIVDEAHRVLPKEQGFGEVIESIVREGRNYDVTVILSTQLLSDLPRSVIENAGLIMYYKPVGIDDLERRLLLNVLEINHEDYIGIINKVKFSERKSSSMIKNYALVKTVNVPHALIIEPYWHVDLDPSSVVKEVKVVEEGVIVESEARSRTMSALNVDHVIEDPCSAYGLSETECKVLNLIKRLTVATKERIIKELNLSDSYVRKILRKLVDEGLVKEVKYYSCRFGNYVKLYSLKDYRKHVHRILVIDLYEHLKQRYGDRVRLLNKPGEPDIEIETDGCRVAVEVETGLKSVKDLADLIISRLRDYGKVIVVYPTREEVNDVASRVYREVASRVGEESSRVLSNITIVSTSDLCSEDVDEKIRCRF